MDDSAPSVGNDDGCKYTRRKNVPLYPPLRASDILADVLTRKMKSIRVHRRRTSIFLGELPLLPYTSIHCTKAI